MRHRLVFACPLLLSLTGCHNAPPSPPETPPPLSQARVTHDNQLFLSQTRFDPWVLSDVGMSSSTTFLYLSDGHFGRTLTPTGKALNRHEAGRYKNGQLEWLPDDGEETPRTNVTLNMQTGRVTGITPPKMTRETDWPKLWKTSDIVIDGDAEAQQVTHSNLFYLLSSTFPSSTFSIPPMGLSSGVYGGHIFWDADVWMLPALLPQHPEYAKPIVAYRFKTLEQAKKNAKAHGFRGAEYAWESADTGKEEAPQEFAKERHITADVGWAAWQYYLWTGDKNFLTSEGWPILQATADYWVSRVTKSSDSKYHIEKVLSPDETAGLVDDDAWTNAVVRANLQAAAKAARLLGQTANPNWTKIADALVMAKNQSLGIPSEHVGMTDKLRAKQADTLLLIHPLGVKFDDATAGKMLDFYASHVSPNGPAMTTSIHAVVAARLGRSQQSLDDFRASFRPFMRAPWNAFSEKRSTNNVYFLTGMAGCVQSVLYGFAGLEVRSADEKSSGVKLAGDAVAALYASPHLPPGWRSLVLKGVQFRGKTWDVTLTSDGKAAVRPASRVRF